MRTWQRAAREGDEGVIRTHRKGVERRASGRTREQPFDGSQDANARARVASVRARVYTRRRQGARFNELDARECVAPTNKIARAQESPFTPRF